MREISYSNQILCLSDVSNALHDDI